jgi:hypothetical protein
MKSSKIAEKTKDIFFRKHPESEHKGKIEEIEKTVEIMEAYFEAKRKIEFQRKNRKRLLHK